jgi:hypothetical protein|tara:strand:+ start:65 stop:349 length:285 start_codon:yes stop_codon:yes gene_type:complete
MKMTTATLKQMIKEELGKDDRVALNNLTAAVEALVQNHGYTIEDVIDVVAAEEGSEVVYAMKGDQVISTREGIAEEGCGYSEPEEEEPKRYFEI